MNFDINNELTVNLPEHQILLSFLNDSDVEPFLDWLTSEGWNNFETWHEVNKEEYKY